MRRLVTKTKLVQELAQLDQSADVTYLEAKVERLQDMLSKLLIRTEDERQQDLLKVINDLNSLDVSALVYYVQTNFGPLYFKKDPDTDFKVALASTILRVVKLRISSYTNAFLQGIATRSIDYQVYLKNFIEE